MTIMDHQVLIHGMKRAKQLLQHQNLRRSHGHISQVISHTMKILTCTCFTSIPNKNLNNLNLTPAMYHYLASNKHSLLFVSYRLSLWQPKLVIFRLLRFQEVQPLSKATYLGLLLTQNMCSASIPMVRLET